MLRRLLNLALIASLLLGGWMPCCADAADAAPRLAESAAPGCHGDAAADPEPGAGEAGPGSLCDDCEHCLSRVSVGVDAPLAGSIAPATMPPMRRVDAPPSAPRAPPLRPPITTSDLA